MPIKASRKSRNTPNNIEVIKLRKRKGAKENENTKFKKGGYINLLNLRVHSPTHKWNN